jgi:hypothetical protein
MHPSGCYRARPSACILPSYWYVHPSGCVPGYASFCLPCVVHISMSTISSIPLYAYSGMHTSVHYLSWGTPSPLEDACRRPLLGFGMHTSLIRSPPISVLGHAYLFTSLSLSVVFEDSYALICLSLRMHAPACIPPINYLARPSLLIHTRACMPLFSSLRCPDRSALPPDVFGGVMIDSNSYDAAPTK